MRSTFLGDISPRKSLTRTRFQSLIFLIVSAPFLVLSPPAFAQTTAGSITGTVLDAQNAVIPNVSVTARNVDQKTVSTAKTDSQGNFVFPLLLPGNYTIGVEASGFKSFERTGVVLNANSLLTVDPIRLQVGGTSETVQVQSQNQEMNTETAAGTDSIVGEQIQNIQVNGQSPLYFLGLTPGVAPTTGSAENTQQYNCCNVNGGTGNQIHVTVNGGLNEDTGGNSGWMAPVSLDAVQEIKIQTNSYDAEYGRAGGAQVSIVTKGGSSQFHGEGFNYFRDRSMNANSWTNNLVGLPKSAYHYDDAGFNVGGPVFFPHFNKNRNKLFFFVDEEWQHQLVPNGQQQVTVPTALERAGNFSQSVNQDGTPVTIINPATGQPFPGNIITQTYAPGLALLNLLPMPNAVSSSHPNYNYVTDISAQHPRREDNFRIDYDPTESWRFYGSFLKATDNEATPYGIWGYTNVPLYTFQYDIPGYHYVLNATKVISSTAVNEVSYVQGHDAQYDGTRPGSDAWTMTGTNVTLPTLYPPYKDFLPGFNFAGTQIGNSPNLSGGIPFYNANTNIEVFDNFSKTIRSHFLKFGIYFDHNWKVQPSGAEYDGAYNFGDDPDNPLNTGFGFADAALGVFDSYSQASAFADGYPLYKQWEFYAQDTWKVNSRLTLSYGIRFYSPLPVHNTSGSNIGQFSNFIPSSWSSAQAPVLLAPALVDGQSVAVNPTTGQIYPAVDVGQFTTSSSLANGIHVLGTSYITKNPGILPAPRIGVIYRLPVPGEVIFHLGAGSYFDRTETDEYDALVGNPPSTVQAQVNYGYVSNLTTGTSIYSPPSLAVWSTSSHVPVTYNYNLGFQIRLPQQMIADIAYVGATQNHQVGNYNINYVPFGAAFLPANQDPVSVASNPGALAGSNALPANFMRPYVGFSTISYYENVLNNYYNALQASLKRRVSTGLFLGVAYTWGKCLGDTGLRWDSYTHAEYYSNCSGSLAQDLTVNYVYALPNVTKLAGGSFDNKATRTILDDWQLSGVSTFTTGTPYSISFDVPGVSGQNFTGTPDQSPVPLCVGNPTAGTSSSPFSRLNGNAFALPAIPSIGLGCKSNNVFGPGLDDWDMSLQKKFRLTENANLEIRGQAFNIFNHAQFTGVNSTIDYSGLTDPTVTNIGSAANNSGFGTVNGVASPRVLELVGKIVF